MNADRYRQELAPLLDAMCPGARLIVKAMMDAHGGHSVDLEPDTYREAMRFFRSALDMALAHGDDEFAQRVRECRRRLGDPDVLMGGS